jgi:hypothetical protein
MMISVTFLLLPVVAAKLKKEVVFFLLGGLPVVATKV